MLSQSDGGKWALAGYLYQVIGMISLTARVDSPIIISRDGTDELLDALICFLGVGQGLTAYHERYEQDVVFEKGDECVIVQFKYSTSARKISRGELREIIEKLEHGARQAEFQGHHVSACALVTNREFTSKGRAARQLWEDERSRKRTYELRRTSASMDNLLAKIREFSKEHGLFEREAKPGIETLIGRVFYKTGDLFGSSINRVDLVEALTGYHSANRLTLPVIAGKCQAEIDEFGSALLTDQWDGAPIERTVFQDVIAAVNERALVGIYGNGGCGKSIILWQLLKQVLDEGRGCCTINSARDFSATWITDTVHRWRNLPPVCRPPDSPEDAIDRLNIANPDRYRPIIWLALDGLDESGNLGQEASLGKLIRWFWRRDREVQGTGELPLATLVVSCRCREDLASTWIGLPPDYSGEWPTNIPVGDFSELELKEAARQKFPDLYKRMMVDYWPPLGPLEASGPSMTIERISPFHNSDFPERQVQEALKHPVMWRALLGLDRDSIHARIAGGETEALHLLSRQFIVLFHWKLTRRVHGYFRNLSTDVLIEILRAIAQHTDGTSTHSRDRDWNEPASQSNHLSPVDAMQLYYEALSGGIITEDARHQWRWRHSIVYNYLISDRQVGE